jgi:hypothetical protein
MFFKKYYLIMCYVVGFDVVYFQKKERAGWTGFSLKLLITTLQKIWYIYLQ